MHGVDALLQSFQTDGATLHRCLSDGHTLKIVDRNGDGKINSADVDMLCNAILNKPSVGYIEANADMNGDKKIDVADIVAILKIINTRKPSE